MFRLASGGGGEGEDVCICCVGMLHIHGGGVLYQFWSLGVRDIVGGMECRQIWVDDAVVD